MRLKLAASGQKRTRSLGIGIEGSGCSGPQPHEFKNLALGRE
jgi:hypothetical protein